MLANVVDLLFVRSLEAPFEQNFPDFPQYPEPRTEFDYEDRYMLASTLADLERDSAPQIPRYWDVREELDYRFEWDESVRTRLREVIEDEGFHQRLPEDWTFSDMEV